MGLHDTATNNSKIMERLNQATKSVRRRGRPRPMLPPKPSFPLSRFSSLRLFTRSPQRRGESTRIWASACSQGSATMSFTGTQDKCNACDKTVHFIDLLTADGVIYHKTCFKCSHCKGILSVCEPALSSNNAWKGQQKKNRRVSSANHSRRNESFGRCVMITETRE
jgi:hypothetical protein